MKTTMDFKKIGISFLCMMLICTTVLMCQTKKKKPMTAAQKKKARTEKAAKQAENFWLDKMWYGAELHFPSFGNGQFNMSISPRAAYKFNRWLSAGAVFKGDYYYYKLDPVSTGGLHKYENLNYGVGLFSRARIFSGLFAQVELENSTFKVDPQIDLNTNKIYTTKISQPYCNVGLGWSSGAGKWQTQIAVYRNILDGPTYIRSAWDLQFGISYNF
ncbi:MAG: hypothetical protein ACOYOA_00680 [Saprospiraceae bacterium]